ncbi:M48 family metallopeptidase [Blastochloris tepida]|uniref:Protease HtpX homolog n=1 Tax=Blastochloris tepida TaxID=2233851 RepID=A0A348G4X8_9HYPH|nr:M48 family metallopeptidase [Blastochloris tepida]BBF94611.1 protease HtpX homolog [Blastochloris tepida]
MSQPQLPPGVLGLRTWIWRNNSRSLMLLAAFPALLIGVTWVLCVAFTLIMGTEMMGDDGLTASVRAGGDLAKAAIPGVLVASAVWFAIAYLIQRPAILALAGAHLDDTSLEARRVRRLLEPLAISRGLPTPHVALIDSDGLNAFAAGWSERDSVVGVTRGLVATLDDAELEAVLAHEMTHVINRDSRLLIVSIVFVGVFALACELAMRSLRYAPRSDNRDGNRFLLFLLVATGILWLGRIGALALRFALSRRREFMADAGALELTKNPDALVSALTRISQKPGIGEVADEVQQMFIFDPPDGWELFSTHPDIEDRIAAIRAVG